MTDYEKLLIVVNNDCLAQSDVVVLLEGDGYNRIYHAAKLYLEGYAKKILFSGGVVDHNYGSYPFEECLPKLVELGVKECDVIYEELSKNTGQQASNVCALAKKEGWKRIILVATPHHQARAYLTFLKQAITNDLVVINSCARWSKWFFNDGWGERIELLEQEQKRIEIYTQKGDLVTATEALEYQKWKEKQL